MTASVAVVLSLFEFVAHTFLKLPTFKLHRQSSFIKNVSTAVFITLYLIQTCCGGPYMMHLLQVPPAAL